MEYPSSLSSHTIRVINDQHRCVEVIEKGNLDENSPIYPTNHIDGLRYSLHTHQRTLLQACLTLEECDRWGWFKDRDLIERDTSSSDEDSALFTVKTNVGVIGDKVGSGKSIVSLALICVKPIITDETIKNAETFPSFMRTDDSRCVVSYNTKKQCIHLLSNLIIVPHTLVLQWEKYLRDVCVNSKNRNEPIVTKKKRKVSEEDVPTDTATTGGRRIHYVKVSSSKAVESITLEDIGYGVAPEDTEIARVVLVSNTFAQEFYDRVFFLLYGMDVTSDKQRQTYFSRVFIDEADTIILSMRKNFNAYFTWFITSSIENLLFSSGSYFRYTPSATAKAKVIHCTGLRRNNYIRSWFTGFYAYNRDSMNTSASICLRNSPSYVSASFMLPAIRRIVYRCITPVIVGILDNIRTNSSQYNQMIDQTISYINANNIDGLKETLGFRVDSTKNIVEMITANLTRRLNNERKHLEYVESLEGVDEIGGEGGGSECVIGSVHGSESKKERIQKIKNKISEMESSIQYIHERMSRTDLCPICYDTIKIPYVAVNCCSALFCMECILQSLKVRPACPCCRASLSLKDLVMVQDDATPLEQKKRPVSPIRTKEQYLDDIIARYRDGRFLIFSNHQASFQAVRERLSQLDICYEMIFGTGLHIERVLRDFRSGKVRVLLMNATYIGVGLNLEMATDVVLYHYLSSELSTQVIGRAQRPNRVGSLRVHYLCHDNELIEVKEQIGTESYEEEGVTNTVDEKALVI